MGSIRIGFGNQPVEVIIGIGNSVSLLISLEDKVSNLIIGIGFSRTIGIGSLREAIETIVCIGCCIAVSIFYTR